MSERAESPPRLVLTTGEMAHGPHAIARDAGKVVFVRGAAPDEEIEVVVTEERRAYAYGELIAVRRPSPWRRKPPCPYLPRCGGCPWQHLDYAGQLRAKAANARQQLARLGGLDVPIADIVPSPHEYGYRQRLKLRVDGEAVGFLAGASHTVVPVADCLLAEPVIRATVPAVGAFVATLAARVRRVEIIATGSGERVVVAAEVESRWLDADDAAIRRWLATQRHVAGLVFHGRRWRRVWGDDRLTLHPEPELSLVVRAGTFTQVNRAANELLVQAVNAIVDPCSGAHVLDLYAGAGNFALPLARRGARVTAVERHPQAAEDGSANAVRLGLTQCRFVCGDAARVARELAAAATPVDAVVLDPPRSGAAEVLPALLRLAPPRVCYVSCDLATLARDLKALAARYRIDGVQPFDLFPHTYHVETVTSATLTC